MLKKFDELIKNGNLTPRELDLLSAEVELQISKTAHEIFITKAKKDPNTIKGILALEAILNRKIDKALKPAQKKAMKALKSKYSKGRLSKMNGTQVQNLMREVNIVISSYAQTSSVLLVPIIQAAQIDVFKKTNKVLAKEFKVKPRFNVKDEKALAFMAGRQKFFIREHFNDTVSNRVLSDIQQQFQRGLGRSEIADVLLSNAENKIISKNKSYFKVVSSSSVNTSRSYSNLISFNDADVVEFEIVSVVDERTTHICKDVMNGRVFSVSVALDNFEDLQKTKSSEEYKKAHPWSSEKETDQGRIYKVNNFSFDEKVTNEALAKAKFTTPPFHGGCRTTMVAQIISKSKYFIMGDLW